jgi:hypothetical protein
LLQRVEMTSPRGISLLAWSFVLGQGAWAALGCSTPVGPLNGTGGDGTGGHAVATGGSSAAGGSGGTLPSGGAPGAGGQLGSGGGECGSCPGFACQAPIVLYVDSDSDAGQVNLADLTATGDGLQVECQASGCSAECVGQARLADGHYSLTLEAAGGQPLVVEFDITNPTNCGCCGCCPGSYSEQVVLLPDPASDGTRACCADLTSSPTDCGACGEVCQPPMACIGGNCLPTP